MIAVKYSENLSIQQLSANSFLLKINNLKVYHYLLVQCEKEFGWAHLIQKTQFFLNGDIEYQIIISEISLESFGQKFFIIEPELLNNISKI